MMAGAVRSASAPCRERTRAVSGPNKRVPGESGLWLRTCWDGGALSAASFVGEIADVGRFRSRGCHAYRYRTRAGVVRQYCPAPFQPRCQSPAQRSALRRAAVTEIRDPGPARSHLQLPIANGSTKTEAARALLRKTSHTVYRRLLEDSQAHTQPATGLEEAA
jgi:hypothetical protein